MATNPYADRYKKYQKAVSSSSTLDDNTDLSEDTTTTTARKTGSSSYGDRYKSYATASAKRLKDKKAQEERDRLYQQEQTDKAAEARAKDPVGTFIGDFGKLAGQVGEAAAENYKRIGEGTAEVINDITGGAKAEQDAYLKRQADDSRSRVDYIKRIKTETDPAKKQRLQYALDQLNKSSDESYKSNQDKLNKRVEAVDPVKGAAAVAGIGLDVVTGGSLKAAGLGTKATIQGLKTGGKGAVKTAVKQLGKNTAKGAAIGGLYGADAAVVDKGKDVTAEDIIRNTVTGAGVGAAIPIAGAGAKVLKNSAPVRAVDTFVSDAAKKAGAKVAATKAGQAVGNVVEKAKVNLGETLAPVMRDFKGLMDKDGRQVNENVRLLDGNVTNSAAITEGRLKENESWQKLGELFAPEKTRPGSLRAARKEKDEIGKFISAKQDAINANKLDATGKKVEVPVGTPKQEEAYRLLNQATKEDVEYAYQNGLLTKANRDKYLVDPDYTRVQRDMSDKLESQFKGTQGANGSLSKTVFGQRLRGSKRAAVDPFAAHFDWSNKVTREVQRQKLSKYIIEQRQAHGLGKGFLRKADNVEDRLAASGEAAQLRVLRNGLSNAIKVESRYGRRLQQELNGLSKQGLQKSIKNAGSSTAARPRSGPKALINTLIKTSTSDLTRIRNKIAVREPKLAKTIDNIIGMKEQHEIVAKAVKELADVARANGDKITTGKTTIKTFTRGIKEIYEDDPRIVDAINRVGKVETHALLKVMQAPSKLIQRTATALNFVFTASNLVKDQVSSAVLSKNAMATHNPISFMLGLKESVLKPTARAALRGVGARKTAGKVLQPSKEYEQFLKFVAGSTRTDISRNLKSTARRTAESLGLKNENVIRKVENINSATENLTRFQNYVGTMRNDLKKGVDFETAQKNAIQAARENSVDFNRTGEWSAFLKIANPFINANIQGSRSLIRAFQERPVSTAMKVAATIQLPIAVSTYYNLSDPKRALIYSQLSDADKNNNLIFITPDGSVLKMPLPPGVKELGAPVRGMIEAEYGYGEQSFLKTAKSLLVDSIDPSNGLTDAVPTLIKPVVEDWANKNFFTNEAIVPDNLKGKDVGDQVFKGTGQTYRDIGNLLGVSPLMVKNTIKGYGSSVAEQTVALVDRLRKAGSPDVVAEEKTTPELLKKKFFDDKPDQEAAAKSVFFDAYGPAKLKRDQASKTITDLVKAGRINEAKRRAEEFNQSLTGKFSKFSKDYKEYETDSIRELLDGLSIPITERSFKARYNQ